MIDQPKIKIIGRHGRRDYALLLEDYTQEGITVPQGFEFDGASIPSVLADPARFI